MQIISKEFHFSAAHILTGLEAGHPCGRDHGHNYILRFFLKGKPNGVGFVRDYNDLKAIGRWIDSQLDHRKLNDVFHFNPTVELMSEWIFKHWKPQFPELFAVEMSETPKTNCRYEED